jgi:DNA-binding NtrC family response regulator
MEYAMVGRRRFQPLQAEAHVTAGFGRNPARTTLGAAEKALLQDFLAEYANTSEVCRRLRISCSSFRRKMKRHDLIKPSKTQILNSSQISCNLDNLIELCIAVSCNF